MKTKFIFPISIVMLVITSAFTAIHSSGHILAPGSPYDGATCAQCHSGGVTTPAVSITANPAFGVGDTYIPGQTYTININCSGNYPKYGFNAEVLDSNSPTTVNDAGICGAPVTSNCQKFAFSGNPTNYTHTAPSGVSNAATFSFNWIAPASGSVFIYAAGLGANNSGTNLGDKVQTTSLTLTESPADIIYHTQNETSLNVYPNPATDNLRINYTLNERSNVTIKLYNLSGELVADLINEKQGRGVQSVDVRLPMEIAKGMYMVKLTINGKQTIEKLLVY